MLRFAFELLNFALQVGIVLGGKDYITCMYYNYIHPLLYSPLDMSLNRLPSPLPHRSCSCTDSSEHYVRPAHVKPRLLALTTLPGRLFQTLTTLPGRLFQTLTTLPGRLFQTLTTLPGRLFQTMTTLPGRLFQTLTIRMSRRTYISFLQLIAVPASNVADAIQHQ